MAYQLQPGIKLVTDNAVPTVCANEEVFMYPQPTSLHFPVDHGEVSIER